MWQQSAKAFPELVYPQKDNARSLRISAFHALMYRDDGLSFKTGYSNCGTAVKRGI